MWKIYACDSLLVCPFCKKDGAKVNKKRLYHQCFCHKCHTKYAVENISKAVISSGKL